MTHHPTPSVQDFMLQVAATKLTSEKLALLNYKLATGSPTAEKIMTCIKPGEWESAVGDTRQFNDIRMRLEAAIDAWVNSNPTSKGFVWPPQSTKLNLTDAAAKLSKLTTDSTSPVSIIRAGAENKIPVYWFNDLKISTYISDFTGDLLGTCTYGPQRLNHTSLPELAVAESVTIMDFQFTDRDFDLMEEINKKAVDDDGYLNCYRHAATKDGTVTVSRDQLFVYAHDLQAYAATLASVTVAAAPGQVPKPATANQVQSVDQVQTVSAIPGEIVKRGALIKRNSAKWKTIDHDLREASRNGLSEAARADKKGWWKEAKAIKWAEINNKLEAPKSMANAATSVINKLWG